MKFFEFREGNGKVRKYGNLSRNTKKKGKETKISKSDF